MAGPDATLRALELGQVDELLIAATPETLTAGAAAPGETSARRRRRPNGSSPGSDDVARLQLSDELVAGATQTGASVRIIEDPELLRDHGGVAAALRFRILTSEELAMSRQNKVNPGQYTSAGRLTPDDLGREMRRQQAKVAGRTQGRRGAAGLGDDPAGAGKTRAPAQGRGPGTGQGRRRARRDRRDACHGRSGEGGQPCRRQGRRRAVQEDGRRAQRPATDGAGTTSGKSAKAKAKRPATVAKRRVSSGR